MSSGILGDPYSHVRVGLTWGLFFQSSSTSVWPGPRRGGGPSALEALSRRTRVSAAPRLPGDLVSGGRHCYVTKTVHVTQVVEKGLFLEQTG